MQFNVIIALGTSRVGLSVEDLARQLRNFSATKFFAQGEEIKATRAIHKAMEGLQIAVEKAISPCGGTPHHGMCLLRTIPSDLTDLKPEIDGILRKAAEKKGIKFDGSNSQAKGN